MFLQQLQDDAEPTLRHRDLERPPHRPGRHARRARARSADHRTCTDGRDASVPVRTRRAGARPAPAPPRLDPVPRRAAARRRRRDRRVVVRRGPVHHHADDPAGRAQRDVAEAALERVGLEATFGDAYSENVPVGAVVATEPGPGERILSGATVLRPTVEGPGALHVPDVAARRRTRPRRILGDQPISKSSATDRGLRRSRRARALVVGTDPAMGTEVKRDAEITLRGEQRPRGIPDSHGRGRDARRRRSRSRPTGASPRSWSQRSSTTPSRLA